MKRIFLFLVTAALFMACNNDEATVASDTTDSTGAKPASEFADPKYTDWGKAALRKFESGDIDGWMEQYADNAVYLWSSGDSLAGKEAITNYWKNRRANDIDSIQFTNDIWLPLQVNTPQRGPDLPGVWLLSWYQVDVKYKGGSRTGFWIHTDIHYNDADKIDRVIQYMDRVPINAAMKK